MGRGKGVSVLRAYVTILKMLGRSRYGTSIAEIIQETGFCRRNVYRYLHAIKEAGLPIIQEKDQRSRHGRTRRWRMVSRPEWMSKVGIL